MPILMIIKSFLSLQRIGACQPVKDNRGRRSYRQVVVAGDAFDRCKNIVRLFQYAVRQTPCGSEHQQTGAVSPDQLPESIMADTVIMSAGARSDGQQICPVGTAVRQIGQNLRERLPDGDSLQGLFSFWIVRRSCSPGPLADQPFNKLTLVLQGGDYGEAADIVGSGQSGYVMQIQVGDGRRDDGAAFIQYRMVNQR